MAGVIVRYVPIYWYEYRKIFKKQHNCEVCANIMVHGIIIPKPCLNLAHKKESQFLFVTL
jgi:hypothetical protein